MIGGTGLLGESIKKLDDNIICFGSKKDIFGFEELEFELNKIKPKIIINAAVIKTEKNKEKLIDVNIIGSSNVAKYCIKNNIRLIYISTDYVYSGKRGNYKETDELYPHNLYAWTKLAGECSTRLVNNHLIIRTSFGSDVFPYEYAYDNLYISKDYVDIISKMILKVIDISYTGVLNIGTKKKSMFEYANKRDKVKKTSLKNKLDFSFNTKLYEKIISK